MDWEARFYMLLLFVIGYVFGKMRGRNEDWIYIGPDAERVNKAVFGVQLKK